MILLRLLLCSMIAAPAFANGVDCGDFLRRYVLHRESAYLILPLVNGDAEDSKRLIIKTAADLRRYQEANADEPWRDELAHVPQGYFREHLLMRTEVGPTGWQPAELNGYLELVKSRIAADPWRARQTLSSLAEGANVEHFSPTAVARVRGRALDMQDARGVLWLTRALMREALIRHKLAVVDGRLKTLGDVLADEDIFFYAAFPELVAFWPWRETWNLRLSNPMLSAPFAITLPPVTAGTHGTCDLEISRLDWADAHENVDMRLRVRPRCDEEGRAIQKWFATQWSHYLDLLAQKTRGETPYPDTYGAFEVEFDSRSGPRGLGFYVFLNQQLSKRP